MDTVAREDSEETRPKLTRCSDFLELLGYAELEDRVRDLERERDVYQFWFKRTLDTAHVLLTERDAALEELRELRRRNVPVRRAA